MRVEPLSASNGLVLMSFGLALIAPPNTFAAYPMTYGPLALVAPEQAWGVVLTTVGALHMWSASREHETPGIRRTRLVTAHIAATWWFALALLVALGSDFRAPMWAPLLLLAWTARVVLVAIPPEGTARHSGSGEHAP